MRCSALMLEPAQPTTDAAAPQNAEAVAEPATPGPKGATAARAPHYDRWETEERLRHIGRVLHPHIRPSGKDKSKGKPGNRRKTRVHSAHPRPAGWHRQEKNRVPAKTRKRRRRSGMALSTWAAISLGVMLLACGGILLGWSVLKHREELWTLGLPIAVAGQVLLLLGLVFQLDRLWHNHRDAAAKLDNVDQQLHDLRSTTAMLGTTHSTPGLAFYSHMAGGASPQLLLADLKGQLDLLAVQIGKRDD